MQVENIECQIAQAQIGNFLAGSGLSDETIRQLEEHIADCSSCKAVLNTRRDELKAMLTAQHAAVDFEQIAKEAEATKPKSIATALRKKSLQQMLEPPMELPFIHQPKAVVENIEEVAGVPIPAKVKPTNSWKPLAYSLGLAAVLVGMSLFSKNIAAVFGPRVSESSTLVASNDPITNAQPGAAIKTGPVTTTESNISNSTTGLSQPVAASMGAETVKPTAETKPEPSSEGAIESTTADVITPTPPVEEPAKSESIAANALGASAGALATTQFEAVEPIPAPPTIAKPNPASPSKPVVVKALPKQVTARRIIRRKPIRRAAPRRAAPVRSRGIKVYNP